MSRQLSAYGTAHDLGSEGVHHSVAHSPLNSPHDVLPVPGTAFPQQRDDEDLTEDDLDPNTWMEDVQSPEAASEFATDDVLALYLNRIGQVPLLTREDEVALGKSIEAGHQARATLGNGRDPSAEEVTALEVQVLEGEVARQHFIEANTRLVVSVAKHYRNYGLPFQDLIQAGNLGLIRAVDKFDATLGNRFSTYAIWWIRQSIKRALSQQGYNIRLPYYLRNQLQRVYHTESDLEKQLNRAPTIEELAAALGEDDIADLHEVLQIARNTVSLNAPVGDEEDSELLNLIADDESPTPAESVQSRMMREDLEAVMEEALSEREIQVLCQRFGLRGYRRHTLQQLSEALEISRERVRQIERKALRKLRHPYHRRKLLEYLR